MLFHANNIENRAVWNAMKIHAELIQEAKEPIVYMVKEENIQILKASFENKNIEILSYTNKLDLAKKVFCHPDKKIFSPDVFSVIGMMTSVLFKNKKVYYWIQGALPEESYMRHKSKIRKKVLSFLEYMAVKLSRHHIMVSAYMQEFFEKKYNFGLNPTIIPCTSDLVFMSAPKEKDSFVYVGGLSAWQKFDQILFMFNKIYNQNSNAKLYIATGNTQEAKELCGKILAKDAFGQTSIQNIQTREEMSFFLSTKEYGFLIREDDIVNNVASPIKLAEYLSMGVNVIISSSVKSYAKDLEDSGAGIMVHTVDDIEKVYRHAPSHKKALGFYEKIFSKSLFVKEYQSILQ